MLKELKNLLDEFIPTHKQEVDFDNQNVEVSKYKYLLTRAIVPDVPELVSLDKITYGDLPPLTKEVVEREVQNHKDALFLVVRHEDQLVAAIICRILTDRQEVIIDWLGVAKEFRHRGIAKKMVETVVAKAENLGLRYVKVLVNADDAYSQNLFTVAGFTHHTNSDDMIYTIA